MKVLYKRRFLSLLAAIAIYIVSVEAIAQEQAKTAILAKEDKMVGDPEALEVLSKCLEKCEYWLAGSGPEFESLRYTFEARLESTGERITQEVVYAVGKETERRQ